MAQPVQDSSTSGKPLTLGAPLPNLRVPIHSGEEINLLDAAGDDWCVSGMCFAPIRGRNHRYIIDLARPPGPFCRPLPPPRLVIFSYPLDKTPICATELITVASLREEFAKRKAKLVGLSVGTAKEHSSFIADLEESRPDLTFDIPIIADEDGSIAEKLGMIHPLLMPSGHGITTPRCLQVFTPRGGGVLTGQAPCDSEDEVIEKRDAEEPSGTLEAPHGDESSGSQSGSRDAGRLPVLPTRGRAGDPEEEEEEESKGGSRRSPEAPTLAVSLCYPPSVGRSFREVLRVLDGLRRAAEDRSIGTPANWQPGQDVVLLPDISDEDAVKKYPDGFASLTPYLRTVPDPGDRTPS